MRALFLELALGSLRYVTWFVFGFILYLLFAGCTPHSASRQVCFARAEANYWVVVEDCKALGLSYEECLPLIPAEKRLSKELDRCR